MNVIKIIIVLASVLIMGCSTEDANDLADRPLSGKVHGVAFTAKDGNSFDDGDGKLSIYITNMEVTCKDFVGDYKIALSTIVPKKEGVYTTNVVFDKKSETALNFLQGIVMIDKITENNIIVKIKADVNSDNFIEGRFIVPFCKK